MNPPIEPPFQTRAQARVMLSCLVATLLLPVVLPLFGLPARAEVYRAVPIAAGPFGYIGQEIYEQHTPIDVLLIGPSVLWNAIDARHLQSRLSAHLNRSAVVRVFGANWPGDDLTYTLLRDVLDQRQVRLVILGLPFGNQFGDRPHVQAFRWLRLGDDPRIFEGQTVRNRAAIYAATVLGGPRQLLTRLRPNHLAADDRVGGDLGGLLSDLGFHGEPFVRIQAEPPIFSPSDMVGSNPTQGWFRVTHNNLGPYQLHFARLIGDLLRAHGLRSAVLHVPMWSDRTSDTVNEAMDWNDVLGVSIPVIGVPGGLLFAPLSPSEQRLLYYDEHLNRNGAEYFTRAVTPAILDYFDDKR